MTAMLRCVQNGTIECPDGVSHTAQQKAPTSRCNACQRPSPHTSNVPVKLYHEIDRRQVLQIGAVALCQPACMSLQSAHAAQQHSGAQSSSNVLVELSTNQTASQYDNYATQYDQLDAGAAAEAFGIPQLRQTLISAAYGNVLEVAIGTGINLRLYNRQQVQKLVGLDVSQGMLQQAQGKTHTDGQGLQVTFQQGDVECLPFGSNTFDCVVDTFSLCVFPKPLQAVKELARVLTPGGKLLLLEHSRSKLPLLGWYQDVTMPAVAAMGKGCKWNQDVTSLLAAAGLEVIKLRTSLAGVITLVEAKKI
ncbi:hypothetical protein WJX79_008298 [Trebouxia sp. C0005]